MVTWMASWPVLWHMCRTSLQASLEAGVPYRGLAFEHVCLRVTVLLPMLSTSVCLQLDVLLGLAGVRATSVKRCPVWWLAGLCCAFSWWLPACRKKFAQIELFNFWSYNQVRYTDWGGS